jgi:hypothetical protein
MKIPRIEFLEALNTVKPALASKDLIEELTLLWFDGKTVMAYNDAELGIQVPLGVDFKGGVRGSLLLGLLSNSRAKEIELTPDGDFIALKAARTRASLDLYEVGRSVWKFPTPDSKKSFRLSQRVLDGLKYVLIATGKDTTTPETLGVTVYMDGESLDLFSTDADTIAADHFKLKGQHTCEHVILPTAFCEQVLRLCDDGSFLEFKKDCVLAINKAGAMIYARTIRAPKRFEFFDMVNKYDDFPKAARFEIPERLSLALDRMGVLFDGMNNETMLVKIGDGVMRMEAHVKSRGDLKDSVVIPDDVPPVSFRTEPGRLKRALDLATHMVCTEDAVRLSNKNGFVYLASNNSVVS